MLFFRAKKRRKGIRKSEDVKEVEQQMKVMKEELVEETVCVEGEKAEEGIRKEGQEVEKRLSVKRVSSREVMVITGMEGVCMAMAKRKMKNKKKESISELH